jgi:hypothetical protein
MAQQKYNPLLKIGFQEVSTGGGGGSQTWADVLALGSSTGMVNPFINDGQRIWFGFNDLVSGHSILGEAGGDMFIDSSGSFEINASGIVESAGTVTMISTDTDGGVVKVEANKISMRSGFSTQTEIELYSTAVNKLSLKNEVLSAPRTQTFPDADGTFTLSYIQTGATNDATQLTLSSSKAVANGSVESFIIRVTAIQRGGSAGTLGDVWVHEFKGAIKQISGVTSLVDTVTDELIAEDVGASGYNVSVEAGTGTLDIKVTGELNKTINWRAVSIFHKEVV